ncbi:MAG: FtsW/RodA/SpoVE family cell cycle protein [Microbacteriaceae bacterium]|nr:FtsW/RodA/SpoVE family cell cycle protein [Microbacteriaceae bacterium]
MPRSTETPARGVSALTGAIVVRLRKPARLRNLEAPFLLGAILVVAAAVALVELGTGAPFDPSLSWQLLGLGGLVVVVHVVLRVVAPEADPFVVPIAVLLGGIGIAQIHRIDIAEGLTGWDAAATRQVVWTAIAIVLAIATLIVVRNHRTLSRYRYLAMLVALILLVLPMLPGIGKEVNGARLWVEVGPMSFQPGEFAKVALAVFFAGYLVTARDSLSMVGRRFLGMRLPRARDLGPILIVFAASMLVLVVQRDLGTALLYFGLFLGMLYVATGRLSWVVLGVVLFVGGALVASRLLPYVGNRFAAWLDPFNPDFIEGQSYQLVQGLYGFAAGGTFGTGLGRGRPDITPLAGSDFIMASLGEELGLVGLFAILALLLLFVGRAFRIGFSGGDDFGRLLAVGLGFAFALQVFVVVGGVTRVIPLTGLTTPFLAAGGSSLVANWIIVALLLRLSDGVRRGPRIVIESATGDQPRLVVGA